MSGRPMSDRVGAIERFLAGNGRGDCRRDPLPVDCSFRRYERLHCDDGRAAMLMDAPPPLEDVRPFVKIARHLRRLGLSVPEIMAVDEIGRASCTESMCQYG